MTVKTQAILCMVLHHPDLPNRQAGGRRNLLTRFRSRQPRKDSGRLQRPAFPAGFVVARLSSRPQGTELAGEIKQRYPGFDRVLISNSISKTSGANMALTLSRTKAGALAGEPAL